MNIFFIIIALIIILIVLGLIKLKKDREKLSDDDNFIEPPLVKEDETDE